MPFLKCVYSGDQAAAGKIAAALSQLAAAGLGKPEMYVAVQVDHSSTLLFGGSTEPAAVINVESIGGTLASIIAPITEAVASHGGVKPDRIFVNFSSFDRSNWGEVPIFASIVPAPPQASPIRPSHHSIPRHEWRNFRLKGFSLSTLINK
jgi:phenylpyruvate tautomerase PptA (4-oxalocrotonate tautomerase family)